MSALLQSVGVLNDRIVEADTIGQSFQAVAGVNDCPPWVYVYQRQIEAIREAAEALECLIRGGGGHE